MGMDAVLAQARACTVCAAQLPLGPRPVLRIGAGARVLIIGQAPGTKVHESGVPWQDASGDHLREWLQLPPGAFEDPERIGILPMGLCYPGKAKSGDAPPRPECAPLWHGPVLAALSDPAPLLLLIGQYAQRHYLGAQRKKTLTETVRAFDSYGPGRFPLPHPSWRSRLWMRKNPWFAADVLPALRARVAARLAG